MISFPKFLKNTGPWPWTQYNPLSLCVCYGSEVDTLVCSINGIGRRNCFSFGDNWVLFFLLTVSRIRVLWREPLSF